MLGIMCISKHFTSLLTGGPNHEQAHANTSCLTSHSTVCVKDTLYVLIYLLIRSSQSCKPKSQTCTMLDDLYGIGLELAKYA